jgi:CheY-like chemotaxis protein/GGDEF domain-containing protein
MQWYCLPLELLMAKILCVDDDVNILAGFQRNLRKQFEITNALGGPAALKILEEKGPFGVIITDMRMPGMSGLEFLALAHEKSPETVQVMLTGAADMTTALDAANSGRIFRFLVKPCAQELLVATLSAALDQYELRACRSKALDAAIMPDAQQELEDLARKAQESELQANLVRRSTVEVNPTAVTTDKVTGLPSAVEAALVMRASAEASSGVMVVAFYIKLHHARTRFGASIADQIMNFASQHLANILKAPWAELGLFRWHGEAFVVVVPAGMELSELQVEAKNLVSQPLSYHFETRTRDAYVPVKITAAALFGDTGQEAIDKVDEFIKSQARESAAA